MQHIYVPAWIITKSVSQNAQRRPKLLFNFSACLINVIFIEFLVESTEYNNEIQKKISEFLWSPPT